MASSAPLRRGYATANSVAAQSDRMMAWSRQRCGAGAVGQGEGACCGGGPAVIGAGAGAVALAGLAAGFAAGLAAGLAAVFAAGLAEDVFLGAGFLTVFAAPGVSSTTSGFGCNCVCAPAIEIGSMFSDSGW